MMCFVGFLGAAFMMREFFMVTYHRIRMVTCRMIVVGCVVCKVVGGVSRCTCWFFNGSERANGNGGIRSVCGSWCGRIGRHGRNLKGRRSLRLRSRGGGGEGNCFWRRNGR